MSEFKCEVVELAPTSDKTMAKIKRELGLSQGLRKDWVHQAKAAREYAFPGHGWLQWEEQERLQ